MPAASARSGSIDRASPAAGKLGAPPLGRHQAKPRSAEGSAEIARGRATSMRTSSAVAMAASQ
jgi:hypothetical protein